MSLGLGATSKAMKPSTSFSCFEKNLAAKVARPAKRGVYLNVADATPPTGTSDTCHRIKPILRYVLGNKD